jgi:hypothetical protein
MSCSYYVSSANDQNTLLYADENYDLMEAVSETEFYYRLAVRTFDIFLMHENYMRWEYFVLKVRLNYVHTKLKLEFEFNKRNP